MDLKDNDMRLHQDGHESEEEHWIGVRAGNVDTKAFGFILRLSAMPCPAGLI